MRYQESHSFREVENHCSRKIFLVIVRVVCANATIEFELGIHMSTWSLKDLGEQILEDNQKKKQNSHTKLSKSNAGYREHVDPLSTVSTAQLLNLSSLSESSTSSRAAPGLGPLNFPLHCC